ncbi:succinate dehydrogenase membrane anchor [Salinisphaera sp. T31B1]
MRLSSMVLALAVVVHLATMIIVVQGGLSADEILARTRGSVAWYGFYAIFMVAASVHGAIGLRNIVREHTRWHGRSLDLVAIGFAVLLLVLGLRALQGLFA